MNICCQTLPRAQRTQGIECFNLIQQPLFKLQFHPHTIWPKNDFCELPSKTPHDQYHCSDTVHLHTLFHIVRDKRWLAPSYHDPHPDHYHDPHINHHDDHHHDGDIFLPYCRGRGVSGSISHICRHIAIAPRHALWLDVFIIIVVIPVNINEFIFIITFSSLITATPFVKLPVAQKRRWRALFILAGSLANLTKMIFKKKFFLVQRHIYFFSVHFKPVLFHLYSFWSKTTIFGSSWRKLTIRALAGSEPIQNLWQAPGEILRPPEQNLVWKQYSCPPNKRYGYAGHAKGKK